LDFEKAYDRVNWVFFTKVLRAKGFDSGAVHRIMQLVTGGQTAISINGEAGPFFPQQEGIATRGSTLAFAFQLHGRSFVHHAFQSM
jgi:hypothetical protein